MNPLVASFLLISTIGFAQSQAPLFRHTPKRRAFVINALQHGPGVLQRSDQYETCIDSAIEWYKQGDSEILLPLLKAPVDGCNSEALGYFLGIELQQRAETLLRRVSRYPIEVQRHAGLLAAASDGSGWPADVEAKMRALLLRISNSSDRKMKKVAKIWLLESEQFQERRKESE